MKLVSSPESILDSTGGLQTISRSKAPRMKNASTVTSVLPAGSVNPVLDLAAAGSHFDNKSVGTNHALLLAAFGTEPMHEYGQCENLDLQRAVFENSSALRRSYRFWNKEEKKHTWDYLTFQFGSRAFLCIDKPQIRGYAETPAMAKRLVRWFISSYLEEPPKPTVGGSFKLIKHSGSGIGTTSVPLQDDSVLHDETFVLHYGQDTDRWHRQFLEKLQTTKSGISILEGPPGTGKTSYLRHLMGLLRESHRFYFIPPSSMAVLSDPTFVEFWADERLMQKDRQLAVILEDSDAALMTRDSDNRNKVSALLNLSDGMMADFLRLQIVCTINCTVGEIDQALLRPGRLISHRVFSRLDYRQASRLAESLGKSLPVVRDYSLAEVFAGHDSEKLSRPCIGFAA